ncbi:MAG: mechanosensitive ion channel family protein, partial [Candidatus Competibacteraceae bacterium]|nr:mechanosensitive ion channel family protein [Candidatus Competibacteraceae bacterium]
MAGSAWGQESVHPLQPLDRSSPRATLKTFLDGGDAVGAIMAQEYLTSPSRAAFNRMIAQGKEIIQCLDLSEVPPASQAKTGRAAAADLYETLSRIQLSAFDEIPDADQLKQLTGADANRWVIPHTEIVLERVRSGPRRGEFLFSAETVAKASEFYARVHELPYIRPVPLQHLKEITMSGGGWMIPYAWIQALPAWLKAPLGGQSVWKWLALVLLLGFSGLLLRGAYRLSRRGGSQQPFLQALAQSTLPAFVLVATPVITYIALVQLNLIGTVGSVIELAATAVMFLAAAWISWRIAPVVAEAIIASPRIAPESIDAHLIRICTRLLGMAAAVGFLAMGADRLGVPLYGIIAGLGVGGLAIALAAQPTIENLIGGFSLFADKPVRVGDLCRYGGELGTIEAIGIRSTRIRGLDRTLTTIPNAALSKMPVVNLAQRDRMWIRTVIGVRYETSPEQLRYLLGKIREMLLGHPRIEPDTLRARFIGFGASSLDIEVYAYVLTREWVEFLAIREDVFLRIMDIVERSGTSFAFPSQTLYFGRDAGLDADKTELAETQVNQWREEGRLPFPNFSPEQMQQI